MPSFIKHVKAKNEFFTSLSRKKRTNILIRFPFGLFRPLLFARASSAWGSCLLNSLQISKRSSCVYQNKSHFCNNMMSIHSWYSIFVHKIRWEYLKLFLSRERGHNLCLSQEINLSSESSSLQGLKNFAQQNVFILKGFAQFYIFE